MNWSTRVVSLAAMACMAASQVPSAQQAAAPPSGGITIDVQVVDGTGRPVPALTPDKFEVTVGGERRRVVSADFVTIAPATPAAPGEPVAPAGASAGRLFVLAIDLSSFTPAQSLGVAVAAQGLVDRLAPADRVAMFSIPSGTTVNPTTDRQAIRRALEGIAGQKEPATAPFGLDPADLVDVARPANGCTTRVGREDVLNGSGRTCGNVCDAGIEPIMAGACRDDCQCRRALAAEAKRRVLDFESRDTRSLEALGGMLRGLEAIPGRKIVVLVSAGMVVGGVAGSHPDLGDLPALVTQQAIESNAVVYTLFPDREFLDLTIPAKEREPVLMSPIRRPEGSILERWLDQFSTKAGGALIKIAGMNPDPAFSRILNETSAYYVIHVETTDADRDDRPHPLSVKVKLSGLTVRWRAAVVSTAPATPKPSSSPDPGAGRPRAAAPSAPAVEPILKAYERGEYADVQDRLTHLPGLAKWIRDFRVAPRPWPDVPRRAAVFALEVAAAGLPADDAATRDEAVKLIVQQSVALGSAQSRDPFECAWYWAGLALFEGVEHPETAAPLLARAMSRCADQPRIVMADAVIGDLASPVLVGSVRIGPAAAAELTAHQAVVVRYEAAMKFPETEAEARVREAWFFYRLKRYDEALALIAGLPPLTGAVGASTYQQELDRQVLYVGRLVEGHILRQRNRADEAAVAYRKALEAWPGAQSARVALMTLLGTHGQRDEAEALAAGIERAPESANDPWWWFWQGDRQVYPVLIATLRESVR